MHRLCDFDLCCECKKGGIVRTSQAWKIAKKRTKEAAAKKAAHAASVERSASKKAKIADRLAAKDSRKAAKETRQAERDTARKSQCAEKALRVKTEKARRMTASAVDALTPLVPDCPEKHGLRIAVTPGDGYVSCSACNAIVPRAELFHGCR